VITRLRTSGLSCQELVELVTDYVEGTLPWRQRRRFEQHIAGCDACPTYLDQLRATIELTGRLRTVDVDPKAEAELLATFRDWRG
jgi:anti-sigma factor RsiW